MAQRQSSQAQPPMTIRLVSPDVWQGHMGRVERKLKLDERTTRMMRAIVSALHSRHVGITPELAARLAQALLAYKTDEYPEPWRSAHSALDEAAESLTNIKNAALHARIREQRHIVFSASVSYTVYQVAQPIIAMACQQLGYTYLYSDDEDLDDVAMPGVIRWLARIGSGPTSGHLVSRRELGQYQRNLKQLVEGLMTPAASGLPDIFWLDRSSILASLTQKTRQNSGSGLGQDLGDPLAADDGNADELPANNRARAAWTTSSLTLSKHNLLPQTDMLDTAVLLRLSPFDTTPDERQSYQLQFPDRQRPRDDNHREAGVDGVEVTRSEDKIQYRLPSEMLLPKIEQLDRLLNTGYLIYRRPPQPVSLRQVLFVGIMPYTDAATAMFYKTCWFDFASHVSHMLRQIDWTHSEFRWIEGDALHRARTHVMQVAQMPNMVVEQTDAMQAIYRQLFLHKLGWLPAYIDESLYTEPLPRLQFDQQPRANLTTTITDSKPLYADEATDNSQNNRDVAPNLQAQAAFIRAWLKAAWESQRRATQTQTIGEIDDDRLRPRSPASDGNRAAHQRLDLLSYRFIHVLVFLPANLRDSARVNSGLTGDGLHQLLMPHVSARVQPEWMLANLYDYPDSDDEPIVAGSTADAVRRKTIKTAATQRSTHHFAGQIIRNWLNQMTEDVQS